MGNVEKPLISKIEQTPKAFANVSPGLERATTLGYTLKKKRSTLKGFVADQTLSGFRENCKKHPQGCSLRSNPGLELANAFGVI